MNSLDTNRITRFAPYKVWYIDGEYRFETDHSILYAIDFKEEAMFLPIPAYWFNLMNRSGKASPNDVKTRATVTCIIEEFFRANPDILLYLCDNANDQQAIRSRLFLRWFNGYAQQENYYIRTEKLDDEGEENYVAIIVPRQHPYLDAIIKRFDAEIAMFKNDKPQ